LRASKSGHFRDGTQLRDTSSALLMLGDVRTDAITRFASRSRRIASTRRGSSRREPINLLITIAIK
jgi:hypothetical protein